MFSPRRAADLHHDAVVSRALQQELARIDELHGGPLNKNFGVEDLFDLLVAQLAAYGKHVDALRPRVLEQADRGGHDDEELKKTVRVDRSSVAGDLRVGAVPASSAMKATASRQLWSVRRDTTSRWPKHGATNSPTTSSATSYLPSADGSWCRQRAAPTATITATVVGQSAPSGVRAMAGIWRGAAIAAQPFTHRSRDRTAESAIEAPYPYGKTSNAMTRRREPNRPSPRRTVRRLRSFRRLRHAPATAFGSPTPAVRLSA
jgi:hypothetical protein